MNLANHRLLVEPNGMTAVWVHPLDLTTGNYPQYEGWTDCTDMDDDEFEAFVVSLQQGA